MSEKNSRRAIVFCDFDGTITACETFFAFTKHFSPTLAGELIPKILAEEITIQDGVRRIVESIPSSVYPDQLLDFVKDKPIREGLSSFLDYLDSRSIPFVVVSGGFQCIVEGILQQNHLFDRCAKVYSTDLDYTNEHLRVQSQWQSDSELMDKSSVIRHECQSNEKIIVIGDSITDVNAAKVADLVFARDRLCHYLKKENIPFYSWNDFHEIRQQLEQIEDRFLS